MVMLIDERRFLEGLQPVPYPGVTPPAPGDPGYWKLWTGPTASEPSEQIWGSSIEGPTKTPGIQEELKTFNQASMNWGAFWGWPWGFDRDDQSNEENPKGSETPFPEFKEPVTSLMDYLMLGGFILLGVWVAGKV